jgi:hypothetical protein
MGPTPTADRQRQQYICIVIVSNCFKAGFKSLGTKQGVQIFAGESEGQKILLVKGIAQVRVSRETIKRCFITTDDDSFNHLFSVIDPMVRPYILLARAY